MAKQQRKQQYEKTPARAGATPIEKAVRVPRKLRAMVKHKKKPPRPTRTDPDEIRELIEQGWKYDRLGRLRPPISEKSKANLKMIGRPKGVRNKVTKDIIESLLQAGTNVGFLTKDPETGQVVATCEGGLIGYFESIAMFTPELYMSAIRQVIPINVVKRLTDGSGNDVPQGEGLFLSREQLEEAMVRRGIPVPVLDEDAFKNMKVISPPSTPKVKQELLPPLPPQRPKPKVK